MHDINLFIQQHTALAAAFLFLLFLLMIIEFVRLKRSSGSLTPMKAVEFINHKNATVVDISSAEAYKNGHIVDAISIPLSSLLEKPKKLEKYKSNPIILVCANGTDSLNALPKLQTEGYMVYSIANGMRGWRSADMPIIKG